MDKSKIVKLFLKNGYQLDKPSLEFFLNDQSEIQPFLSILEKSKEKPKIITLELIKKLLKTSENFQVIRDFRITRKQYEVEDYVSLLDKRYENYKKLLIGKLRLVNPISISKISSKTKKFSLIVLVREKDESNHSLVVEDVTGKITVNFSDELLEEFKLVLHDEVIGLVCENGENITVKKVIWPDIPIRRSLNRTSFDVKCLFISFLGNKESKNSFQKFLDWLEKTKTENLFIFILGEIPKNYLKNVKSLTKGKVFIVSNDNYEEKLNDPVLVKIGKVHLFISSGELFRAYKRIWNKNETEICFNLIKKRHLKPTIELNQPVDVDDPYFLGIIPDIFVCGYSDKPESINYKGVTILSTGSFSSSPIFWLVNLKTRELFKLDFT